MRNKVQNDIIKLLRCPKTKQKLSLTKNGSYLVTIDKKNYFPIINKIPRFVEKSNYADNFGMQWNHFRRTQLDSVSKTTISYDRFFSATGWNKNKMKNKWILDAGCGSGRFAEIALKTGAKVVALDYSSAVDAIYKNLKPHPNLFIVQGDIYKLPFAINFFDYVYCLGVLQHTPNVKHAFKCLLPFLKPKGHICVDFYWKRFRTLMHSKYIFRPITKNIPKKNLFKFLEKNITKLLAVSTMLGKIPFFGIALKRIIPVANYVDVFPLSKKQHVEWALLDTFDMLSPTYDKPQSIKSVKHFFDSANLINIEIFHASHLVGRAQKKIKS